MKLSDVITAILAMRIVVQFMAQSAGIVLLRRREGSASLPFRMWLYPLPVVVSLLIWGFLFYHTGVFALYGLALAFLGVMVFFLTHRHNG
jgi:hypothetical protein